jgi:hypothetical protein
VCVYVLYLSLSVCVCVCVCMCATLHLFVIPLSLSLCLSLSTDDMKDLVQIKRLSFSPSQSTHATLDSTSSQRKVRARAPAVPCRLWPLISPGTTPARPNAFFHDAEVSKLARDDAERSRLAWNDAGGIQTRAEVRTRLEQRGDVKTCLGRTPQRSRLSWNDAGMSRLA